MPTLKKALAGSILLGLFIPLLASETPNRRIVVRILSIPKEQQVEIVLPDAKGKQVSFQGYADVAANFPRATVLFRTELASNASEEAIARTIMDHVNFGSGAVNPQKVQIRELKSVLLGLGKDHSEAEARFEESRGEGRTSDYQVRALWLGADKNGTLLRLRFDAGWSSRGGSLGVGISDCVVSLPVDVPDYKMILIGASSFGEVYWLAVCALPD